jgi:hypothetical membrane protein
VKILLRFSWIGPLIFFLAIIIFGFLHPSYSHFSQFISELGADNAPNNLFMNYLGIIPFGISICLYSIAGTFYSDAKIQKLAFIILLITGLLFVIAGLFNCDEGCAFDNMSQKSIIHNLSAFSAFLLSIIVQLVIGTLVFAKRKTRLITFSLVSGITGIILFYLISNAGIYSDFRGLYQRLFLTNFLIWLIISGNLILKTTNN